MPDARLSLFVRGRFITPICAAGAAVALATSADAPAQDAQVLKPARPWTLDYGQERCSLVRQFGDEKGGVTLRIDSFGSWTGFHYLAIGTAIPRHPNPTGDLRYRFSVDSEDHKIDGLWGTGANRLPAVSFSTRLLPFALRDEGRYKDLSSKEWLEMASRPSLPDADFEAGFDSLTLKFDSRKQIELRMGDMAKPLAALRTCIDDLRVSWGLDLTVEKRLSREATPLLSTVRAVQGNYPSSGLSNGLNALVPVRVMVDAEGNAGACVVQAENVDDAFRKAVCGGLSKRYQPALDEAGNTTASFFQTSVVYLTL